MHLQTPLLLARRTSLHPLWHHIITRPKAKVLWIEDIWDYEADRIHA